MSNGGLSFSKRLEWLILDNVGKISVLAILLFLATQYPDHAKIVLDPALSATADLYVYLSSRSDIFLGVLITILANHVTSLLRGSREIKGVGRALHTEAKALFYKAKFHYEALAQKYDASISLEQREEAVRRKLKSGELSDWPDMLFCGPDYMPFFRANAAKLGMLRARWPFPRDEVLRLSISIHCFVVEYPSVHQKFVGEARKAAETLNESLDSKNARCIVQKYMRDREEYLTRIRNFENNCNSLIGLTERFR